MKTVGQDLRNVIKRPLISEKNTYHNAANVYVFQVDLQSTKSDVLAAVEKNFKVKVDSVRTSVCRGKGKVTKFGRGLTPRWKKAYVKLVEGEKIALFEGA